MKRVVAVGMLGVLAVLGAVMFRHRSAGQSPADRGTSDQGRSEEETAEKVEAPAVPAAPTLQYRVVPPPSAFAPEAEPVAPPAGDRPIRSTVINLAGNYGKGVAAAPPTELGGAAFMNEYRAAVCACSSRACVRGLQSSFMRRLGSVQYNPQRDGGSYAAASREATACYARLPES